MRAAPLFVVTVCALAVGGCYASHVRESDAGPPTDANLPDPVLALRRAWCESLARCPEGTSSWTVAPLVFYVDVDACVMLGRSFWDMRLARGVHLDADAARACAAALGTTCLNDPGTRYVPFPAPCLAMLGDQGPGLGEACSSDLWCGPGLTCDGGRSGDCDSWVCRASTGSCLDTCLPVAGALPRACHDEVCVQWIEGPTGGVGAPCGIDEASDGHMTHGCDVGLVCDQSGAPDHWRCAAPPGLGEPCGHAGALCAPGLTCAADGTCEPIVIGAAGAPCASAAPDPCDARLDLHCVFGRCQRLMPDGLGGTCQPESARACGGAHLCSWTTSTCADIAPLPRALGEPCTNGSQCVTGMCVDGACAAACP